MADVLKTLGTGILNATSSMVYTAPSGVTTVVRNIHVCNVTSGSVTFSLNYNATAGGAGGAMYNNMTVAGYGVFDWSGFWVLPPTIAVYALAASANSLVLSMSGVESS